MSAASASAESAKSAVLDSKIVKIERFDVNGLANLLLHDGIDRDTKNQLKAYKRMRQNGNEVQVIYEYGKDLRKIGKGRMYPQKGLGLQCLPSDVRAVLASKYGWDIDMVNSQPVILLQLCERNGWVCDNLRDYVMNRASKLEEIQQYLDCDRDGAKTVCLATMFGAKYNKVPNFIKELAKELEQIGINLVANHTDLLKICSKQRNPAQSCIAHVIQDQEFRILQSIDAVFRDNNRVLSTYIHDGGIVDKLEGEEEFPTELLRIAEQEIYKIHGIRITLLIKPMIHSFSFKKDVMRTKITSEKEYQQRKDEFEENHFYCVQTETICTEKDGVLSHTSKSHASMTFSKYNFQKIVDNKLQVDDFIHIWSSDPYKRIINNLIFYPDVTKVVDDSFNTFTGLTSRNVVECAESEAVVERFKLLVYHNAGKRPEVNAYMINWFASLIQNPYEIPGVAIILINTDQGSGKETLGEFIGSKVIGPEYYKNIRNAETELFDTHTTAFDKTLFMKLEEVNGSTNRKFCDMLKAIITSTSALINPKGMKKYTIDAFPHILMTTNNAVPVKTEKNDRRFMISYTSSDYVGDSKFWTETYRLLGLDGAGHAVYNYLMSIDLSAINIRDFPKTDYHEILAETEIPSEIDFITKIESFANTRATVLHDEYRIFCNEYRLEPKGLVHFTRCLAPALERGIITKRVLHGVAVYSKK
jgi:hypothetical protein